jgi:hypothetical protein
VIDITLSRGAFVRSWISWLLLPVTCILAAGASAAPPESAQPRGDSAAIHDRLDALGPGGVDVPEAARRGQNSGLNRSHAAFVGEAPFLVEPSSAAALPAVSEALQGLLCLLLLLAARQGVRDS